MPDAMGDYPAPGDESSDAPDDLADITKDDYAVAAETLAQEAAQTQEPATEADGVKEPEETDGTPREQRYRQRARAAEAEVGQLRELVDSMRSAEVERLAAGRLADPGDIFRDGGELADVLDADGRVDPGKLDAFIAAVIARHPHWRAPLVPYRGPFLSGSTNTRSIDAPSKGFAAAFGPKDE